MLPFSLTERAHIDPESVQHWTSILLGCYGFAVVIGAPAMGYFSSSFPNRRTPLFLGLVALLLATILLCIGSNIIVLAFGRLCQGLSAAVVGTMGLALVADTFEQSEIGKAMGYVSLASSIAAFISPLLGGVVYSQGGYYAVFGMCFGLVLLDLLLRLSVVEKVDAVSQSNEADVESLYSLVGEGESSDEHGSLMPSDPNSRSPRKGVHKTPSQNRQYSMTELLLSPRLPVALSVIFVRSLLLTSFDATLPLFVNNAFGWTSLGSGLIFLPFILPLFLAPYVGSLADKKFQPRLIASVGFFIGVPLLITLRLVGGQNGLDDLTSIILLVANLVGVGAALVLMLPPTMVEIERIIAETNRCENEAELHMKASSNIAIRGQVYGLLNCAWALGTLAGPLWGGFVVSAAGWGTMTLSLAVLSGVTGSLAVRPPALFVYQTPQKTVCKLRQRALTRITDDVPGRRSLVQEKIVKKIEKGSLSRRDYQVLVVRS